MRVAQREFLRPSTRILMDGQQGGHASALRINTPQQMAGALGRDHDYINVFRRLNGLEVNCKSVREAENLAGMQMRLDRRFVEIGLGLVGRKNLEPIGA